jgi:hypothetical protein
MIGFQDAIRVCGIHLVRPVEEAGVADTLVATLKHESAYCVAAAAAALCVLGDIPDGGKGLLEESGAIAALVRLLKSAPPPSEVQRTGPFRRCVMNICADICMCMWSGWSVWYVVLLWSGYKYQCDCSMTSHLLTADIECLLWQSGVFMSDCLPSHSMFCVAILLIWWVLLQLSACYTLPSNVI